MRRISNHSEGLRPSDSPTRSLAGPRKPHSARVGSLARSFASRAPLERIFVRPASSRVEENGDDKIPDDHREQSGAEKREYDSDPANAFKQRQQDDGYDPCDQEQLADRQSY